MRKKKKKRPKMNEVKRPQRRKTDISYRNPAIFRWHIFKITLSLSQYYSAKKKERVLLNGERTNDEI